MLLLLIKLEANIFSNSRTRSCDFLCLSSLCNVNCLFVWIVVVGLVGQFQRDF